MFDNIFDLNIVLLKTITIFIYLLNNLPVIIEALINFHLWQFSLMITLANINNSLLYDIKLLDNKVLLNYKFTR